MKNLFFVLVLTGLVACGAPAQHGEESVPTDNASLETAIGDEVEGQEGDEALEIPPVDSLRLSEVLANLEIAGHTFITEVEFEDGAWEVEYVVGDEVYEIRLDPMTGEALPEEPEG